jgi:hypothetical protein
MLRTRKSNLAMIETLESHILMSGVALGISELPIPGAGTQLRITGTSGNDQITVRHTSAGLIIGNTGGWTKTVTDSIQSLWIHGGAGNNSITLDASVTLNATLFGGGANDTLMAGSGNNALYGGTGKNLLQSRSGNDTLVTIGSTADTLVGGTGHDSFWTDDSKAEIIKNLTPQESSSGAVHRVGSFCDAPSIAPVAKAAMAKAAVTAPSIKEPAVDKTLTYSPLSNEPIFASTGPSENDIFQGNSDDCYFLSVLSSVAKIDPTRIQQSILDMGDGTAVVQLFKNNKPVYVREDELLPTSGGTLSYAGLGTQNSTWVALMEKAFAYTRTSKPSYASLDLGWMDESYRALGVNNPTSTYSVASASALMTLISKALAAGQSVTCATANAPANSGLISNHAYTVDKVNTDSKGNITTLTLRNPWGCNADGTGNGYITISAATAFKALAGEVTANV